MWFGSDVQLERNWSEVQIKVDDQVGTWLRSCLSLKRRAEVWQLGQSLKEINSQWSWVPGASIMNNSESSLIRRLARNALPLYDLAFMVGQADLPDCPCCNRGGEETAVHVGKMTSRIDLEHLEMLDVEYSVDNIGPPWRGGK